MMRVGGANRLWSAQCRRVTARSVTRAPAAVSGALQAACFQQASTGACGSQSLMSRGLHLTPRHVPPFECAAQGTVANALPTSSQPQTAAISVSAMATFGTSTPPRLFVTHATLRQRDGGADVLGAYRGGFRSLCQSLRAKGPALLIGHRCCPPMVISERWSPGEEEHSPREMADAQGVSAATASRLGSEKTIVSVASVTPSPLARTRSQIFLPSS